MENEEKVEVVETNPNDEILTFLKALDEKISLLTDSVNGLSKQEEPTEEPAEEPAEEGKEEVTEEVTEEQPETTDEELEDLASYLS